MIGPPSRLSETPSTTSYASSGALDRSSRDHGWLHQAWHVVVTQTTVPPRCGTFPLKSQTTKQTTHSSEPVQHALDDDWYEQHRHLLESQNSTENMQDWQLPDGDIKTDNSIGGRRTLTAQRLSSSEDGEDAGENKTFLSDSSKPGLPQKHMFHT